MLLYQIIMTRKEKPMYPVGIAISVVRQQRNLTAAIVAKKLGISRSFLSIIETGIRIPPLSLDFVHAVSEFLDLPEHSVLSSIACEHFFSELKKFEWLPNMFCSGVSIGFRRYYLIEDHGIDYNETEDNDLNSCEIKDLTHNPDLFVYRQRILFALI